MPFYRDTISFFVAITLVLAVASNGVVRPWEGVFFLLNYLFYVALVIAIRYYIQPCWPEDTFGVYLRGKAQPVLQRAEPALRAISRRATPLARGAAERAKPIARQVRHRASRASSFFSAAGQGLLAQGSSVAGAPPPLAAPAPPLVASPPVASPLVASPLVSSTPLLAAPAAAPGRGPSRPASPRGVSPTPPRQVEMVPEQAPPRLDGSEAPERGTPHVAPESGTAPLVASGASALGLGGGGGNGGAARPVAAHAVCGEEAERGGGLGAVQVAVAVAQGEDPTNDNGGRLMGSGGAAAEAAEEERCPMAGLEWDAGASRLSKALWLLEWPLSVLRWATIPTDSEWDARRRRWTAATPPFAAVLLLVRFSGGVGDAAAARAGPLPLLLLLPLCCAPLPYALWRLTRDDVPPAWQPALVVTGFCFSIVWLDLVATEVVALIETAGFLLGISTSILGLTVIAIGNSAGDLVSDIAAAKGGEAKMAVAACFGSPLLMNIIGAGASLTVRAIMTGGADTESSVSQVCRIAYLFLYTALFSHMVVFPLCGYSASRGYAVYLFALYAVFMLLALLAESRKLGDFLCPASSPCPPPDGPS